MMSWRSVDPAQLQKQFREDVEDLLTHSPHTWVVTYGYRSLIEQATLYAKYRAGGPRAAPPGKSAHNYGLAIDVALDGSPEPGLQPDWDTSHEGWEWLFSAVFAHPRLHSGRHFADACHVEAFSWEKIAGLK